MTCNLMSYLRRPAKSKLKKLQAWASTILKARCMMPTVSTTMDITKMIAESWNERVQVTLLPFPVDARALSISDGGCLANGIRTFTDSTKPHLPNLGPLTMRIKDAGSGTTSSLNNTRIHVNDVTGKSGRTTVAPIGQSLGGIRSYTDQGYVIVYQPHFSGVLVHCKKDVDINWSRPPVRAGWRKRNDKLWHWSLKMPLFNKVTHCLQGATPWVTPVDIKQLPQGTVALANKV